MRFVSFLICITALISCTEITFLEPQPKGIKNLKFFPSSLRGKYIITDDSLNKKPDTVLIGKQSYRITGGSEKEDWLNKGNLSDSIVLKKYKGYYFLNFYTEKQWIVRTFKQEKNGDVVLMEINLSDEKTLANLNTKLHPEIIKNESDTFYRIDPAPAELLDFVLSNAAPQPPLRKIE